jgi:hypothetical protein
MLVKQFHYISKEESQMVLESIIKAQSNCAFNVGCRFANFRSAALNAKILILKSKYYHSISQKRGVKHLRTIPISNRLYQAIGEYLKTNDISIESSFSFKNCSRSYFEKTMWEALNLISKKQYPGFASACLTAFVCNAPSFCRFIFGRNKNHAHIKKYYFDLCRNPNRRTPP